MLDPVKLRACMEALKSGAEKDHEKLAQSLMAIVRKIQAAEERKRQLIDLYASGHLPEAAHVDAKHRAISEQNAEQNAEQGARGRPFGAGSGRVIIRSQPESTSVGSSSPEPVLLTRFDGRYHAGRGRTHPRAPGSAC